MLVPFFLAQRLTCLRRGFRFPSQLKTVSTLNVKEKSAIIQVYNSPLLCACASAATYRYTFLVRLQFP